MACLCLSLVYWLHPHSF
uniref:Uncharacterized protein n=1 Tax=Anguilla anguilla TaxID=7936 RepID=A0A0E9UBZ6_ANGAN